ncbi:hypothetical protein C8J56DRAFT_904458 [Mycena floridula]|nr:hypothetical protein C8J56DRAFT_907364 [Mycena floridula]KAJ7572986.1 hypothetical protein C8J56DRAFT_904458 [Mycena floridula]
MSSFYRKPHHSWVKLALAVLSSMISLSAPQESPHSVCSSEKPCSKMTGQQGAMDKAKVNKVMKNHFTDRSGKRQSLAYRAKSSVHLLNQLSREPYHGPPSSNFTNAWQLKSHPDDAFGANPGPDSQSEPRIFGPALTNEILPASSSILVYMFWLQEQWGHAGSFGLFSSRLSNGGKDIPTT